MPLNSGNKLAFLFLCCVLITLTGFGMIINPGGNTVKAIPGLPDSTFYGADKVRVPDSLLGKDAVVLYQSKNLSYMINNSNTYETYLNQTEVYHKRIQILTNKGFDDYSRISLHASKFTNLERLSIHIIKPDGRDIKVITAIRTIQEPDDNLNIDEKHLKVSIPNLEIGDVIDVNLKISNPVGFYNPLEVFINEEIPILNSTLTLRFKKGLITRIRTYNDLPAPEKAEEKGDSIFSWSFSYLKAIPPQNHSIPANEVPFVRYMIKEIRNSMKYGIFNTQYPPGTWGDIFKELSSGIDRPNPKNKNEEYYQEFLDRQFKDSLNTPNLQKLRKIVAFINDSMELTQGGRSGNYSSGYYLYTKKIDYASLLNLYQDLFKSFNFNFYYVFSRDKTDGELDTCMISRHTYTDYYFAFRSDTGAFHYLYPRGVYYKPHVDEVQWQFQGTRGFLVNPKNPRDYKVIKIPQWTCTDNTYNMKGNIAIDIEKNSLKSDITISFTGTKSTQYRPYEEKDSIRLHFEKSIKERFDGFKLEEFFVNSNEPVFPFRDSVVFKGTQKNVLTRIEDSTWSFPLRSWLDHGETTTPEMNRILDYYLGSPYSETFTFNFVFPYPVEFINRKNLQCNYSNLYGGYSLIVNQKDATTICVESTYVIKNDHIPKGDYSLLKEINNQLKNFRDARLIVRKL